MDPAMRGAWLATVGLALGACASAPSARSVTAIVDVTVVRPDRDGAAALLPHANVVIAGDRIAAVGPAATTPVPEGATRIDGRGRWAIPGLIDGHVHFFQSGNLYTRPDVADFNAWMPYREEVARNKARLPVTFRVWLASGVTSVVDVGGPLWNFAVRHAARASPAAPRVAVAGPLISMVARPQLDLGDPPIVRVDSAAAARAMVKRLLDRKPDYVKVWYIHRAGDDLAAQEAIVRAAAEQAHASGVPLAVHATELEVAKSALRAGADYLVHSVDDAPVDDEFIALAKRNHALYCPTLFVIAGYRLALANRWTATAAEKRLADPQILDAMHDIDRIPAAKIPPRVARLLANPGPMPGPFPYAMSNLPIVWKAGIPVVMGTDAGNIGTLHGPSVFREMGLMQQAGLTPLEVLRAATVNGAKAMREPAALGLIAPGRLADLVLLDDDPLADVANLSHIHRVVKGGKVFDPRELVPKR